MLLKLKLLVFSMLAILDCNFASASEQPDITIYYAADNPFQSNMADAISRQLREIPFEITPRLVTDHDLSKTHPDSLIINIGDHDEVDPAFDKLKNSIIHINDIRIRPAGSIQNKNYTNIEITQPPCRYLALIKNINSKWERVGYLSTSENDDRLKVLEACASKLDFHIVNNVITEDNSLSDATDRLLRDSDVLLALPDNKIYNRHSVKNILLTAYRHRISVIGFSDNFVRAGALAGVYSTPDQLARQVVTTIKQYLDPDISGIHQSISPTHYSVSINSQVAKALDIVVKDESQIEKLMQSMEGAQ